MKLLRLIVRKPKFVNFTRQQAAVLRLPSFVAPHLALKCDLKIFQHHWLPCLLLQNLHRSHPWIQDIAGKENSKSKQKTSREGIMTWLILKPWQNRLVS